MRTKEVRKILKYLNIKKRRTVTTITLLILILCLTLTTILNNLPDDSSPTNNPTTQNKNDLYRVIKIIDGDTITVDIEGTTTTLRLIGINTPETADPRKPVECYGIEASNRAKELLTGKNVRLESDPSQEDRDKYERLLRYVYLKDGTFYNEQMIKDGYAYEYTYDTPYQYQSQFKAAEDYARTNKLGLWADDACGPK